MKTRSPAAVLLSIVAAVVIPAAAHAAAPDLRATLTGPAELANGFDQRLIFEVQNVGGARAGTVTQTLRFSNRVTILEAPYWCPVTNQGQNKVVTCTNASLAAGGRLGQALRIRAPGGSGNSFATFTYTATTAGDTIQGNNTASLPMHFSASFTPPAIQAPLDQAMMTTCSGSGPFDWSQCGDSSYQIHQIEFDSAGQVLYQGQPVGIWFKPTARTLTLEFIDNNVVEAVYQLDTASTSCYRGVGSFPNSTWFARMQLCF